MEKKEKKYEMIIRRTKEVIKEFSMKLTLRQMFYQLVASNDLPSNRSQYVYFDKVLTEYRQKNTPFSANFEDRTRKLQSNTTEYYPFDNYSQIIESKINEVKTDYPTFWYNANLLQDKVSIIFVEKQALEGIFERAIGNMSILVVARGFNSFTQMYELSKLLKILQDNGKELHLYMFSDFDDSGLFIQENFLFQMKEYLDIDFDSIKRIALTKELIEKYSLPVNPTKTSTHSKYNLPYFVELDALNPNILTKLIRNCCEKNFDYDLKEAIQKVSKYRNRRLKKAYFRELKKVDLSTI